jgi:AcrR family transcriptional regulator
LNASVIEFNASVKISTGAFVGRYKDRVREQREQEIIQTAQRMLVENGFASFNMEEVAEQVGISKPTLYQHFDSRDTLIVRVIMRYFHELGAEIEKTQDQPPVEQIKHRLRLMMKGRYKSGALFPQFNPEFIQIMRSNEQLGAMREQAMQQLDDLIEQGKAAGQIRSDVPTPIISRAMFCLQGALFHHLHEAPDESSMDQNIEYVISILMQGIQS